VSLDRWLWDISNHLNCTLTHIYIHIYIYIFSLNWERSSHMYIQCHRTGGFETYSIQIVHIFTYIHEKNLVPLALVLVGQLVVFWIGFFHRSLSNWEHGFSEQRKRNLCHSRIALFCYVWYKYWMFCYVWYKCLNICTTHSKTSRIAIHTTLWMSSSRISTHTSMCSSFMSSCTGFRI